jgi:hypothetical protein
MSTEMTHEKCTQSLPPVRVGVTLETTLMRLAARDDRSLSEYIRHALTLHAMGHAATLHDGSEPGKWIRAQQCFAKETDMQTNTQGRRLIAALKRRPLSYLEMNMLGISVCPQKRVVESLRDGEQLVKATGPDGRLRWRVVSATRWTA